LRNIRGKIALSVMLGFLLFASFSGGCRAEPDFDSRLNTIIRPHVFSILNWEVNALLQEVRETLANLPSPVVDDKATVTRYFSYVDRLRHLDAEIQAVRDGTRQGDLASLEAEAGQLQPQAAALADTVERILEMQLREVLSREGIHHPVYEAVRLKLNFPPLNFSLEEPPHILIVSPRDRIESIREITLVQEITPEEIEAIESEVDAMNVASLVVELGGFAGTYPSFVTRDADLRFTMDTAAEEWLHQYLAFKPLGFRYLLDVTGIHRDYEIATINETVASMVSKEIGQLLYDDYNIENGNSETDRADSENTFNFNREMREIRKAVDGYLADGQVEQAEAFMEEKRQYLASHGYHLRKLNQAYFAFYGTYADRPTSISPIGVELKELRDSSGSLQEFLEATALLTSRQDLAELTAR